MTLSAPTPLTPEHHLSAFSSGVFSLDDWLRRRALPNQRSGASRTFVIVSEDRVVAYTALAASSITLGEATGRFARNMPDPVPVIVLGRLAVDAAWAGRGIGRALLRDAGLRVLAASDIIGVRGMIVHAISEDARRFYQALGMRTSPLDGSTLMATCADLRQTARP